MYRQAIQNFVTIVSGNNNIDVEFNSLDEQSYTNGKTVTITAGVKEKNFDVVCGLALHEASHIRYSDFDILRDLINYIPEQYKIKASAKGWTDELLIGRFKLLLNFVEDLRIDSIVFKDSPGYKGYYHSLYDEYAYHPNISKGLKSRSYRKKDWDSYTFRLISITNKDCSLKALPGLEDCWRAIDIQNIHKVNNKRGLLRISLKLLDIILDNIDKVDHEELKKHKEQLSPDDFRKFLEAIENGDTQAHKEELPQDNVPEEVGQTDNVEDSKDFDELTTAMKKWLEKKIKKYQDLINGISQKTKVTQKEKSSLKAVENSNTIFKDIQLKDGTNIKCVVIKNLTKESIESNTNPFTVSGITSFQRRKINRNVRGIEKGIQLGTKLGKKLQIRNEERPTQYNRKKHGKIDKRMLSNLGFNDESIFEQTYIEKYEKASLHLSIDASGSMSSKWEETMTATVAIAKAFETIQNVDLVISFRGTYDKKWTSLPAILIAYDSRVDKFNKIKTLFKYLSLAGSTPEGLCFAAILNEIMPENKNSYFLNISDGVPQFSNGDFIYYQKKALNHTRRQVEKIRSMGVEVLSYFIPTSIRDHRCEKDERDFKYMYGKDSHIIDITNVTQIAKTINQKFLEK